MIDYVNGKAAELLLNKRPGGKVPPKKCMRLGGAKVAVSGVVAMMTRNFSELAGC
ncbi:MAG: hypothetical protein IMF26_03320 [Candidatus Fermentithermobacillus carboniphilus]|uniref:Uncharacterized protein n=1 Tax=Candidatus Fermentithermobacillus carboniphilus TaxID=3085328 RepID=A0AAT9LDK3_9FIRM|nr:MAG: hypothetical protein IMF26_03320 [Candidatus Fermentithermobacillus carboniphilus]